jgi:hypothetical protein
MVGAFVRGFLAALMLPSGVDEKVMLAVAPVVEAERGSGRSGDSSDEGLEGAGGDVGEGEPKGVSESTSTSGVVTGESIVEEVSVSLLVDSGLWGCGVVKWERRGRERERERVGIGAAGSRTGRRVRCTVPPRSASGDDRSRWRDGGER